MINSEYKAVAKRGILALLLLYVPHFIKNMVVSLYSWETLINMPARLRVFNKVTLLAVVAFLGVAFIAYNKEKIFQIQLGKQRLSKSFLMLFAGYLSIGYYYASQIFINQNRIYDGWLPYAIVATQFLSLGIFFAFIILAVFGRSYIKEALDKTHPQIFFLAILAGILTYAIAFFEKTWPFFSSGVTYLLVALLKIPYDVIYYIDTSGIPVIQIKNFAVSIGSPCSGIDSLLLFSAFYAFILALDKDRINRRIAALLFFPGLAGIYLINVLRILLLIIAGAHISPQFAAGLFHTNAGWMLFVFYFLAYYWIIKRFIYESRHHKDRQKHAANMVKEKIKKFLEGKKPYFFMTLYFSDVAAFFISMYLAFYLFGFAGFLFDFGIRVAFFSLLILIVNYSAFGLYDQKRNLFDENQFMSVIYSILITYAIILTFLLLFGVNILLVQMSLGFLIVIFLTILFRWLLYRMIYSLRKAGLDKKKVLFFGKKNEELIKRIEDTPSLGYKVIGHAEKISELRENLRKADVIFITEERISEEMMKLIIENNEVTWKIVPSAFNLIMDRVSFDEFKDYPVVNIPAATINKDYLRIKRLMDIFLSGIALIVLSPLFIAVAILIKITMPGPVFYMHERMGKGLAPFMLYKFRSMIVGADKIKPKMKNEVDALFKMRKDPRVTPFGNFLRRTCIDELPQLINIFKGDMSIVGPRPHLREELKFYKGWRQARFAVKPGLTGMWQVSGRHELNFDKAVLYDIYYIKHMSLVLDLSIILKTLPSIIFSRGRY